MSMRINVNLVVIEVLFSLSLAIVITGPETKYEPKWVKFDEKVRPTKKRVNINNFELKKKFDSFGGAHVYVLPFSPPVILQLSPFCALDTSGVPFWFVGPDWGCPGFSHKPKGFPIYKYRDEYWVILGGFSSTQSALLKLPQFEMVRFNPGLRNFLPIGIFDLDHDGNPEVLVNGVGFESEGKKRRYLALLDVKTGDLLWEKEIGAQVDAAVAYDVNGDGHDELIASVINAENGTFGLGMVDFERGQFFVMDRFGNVIFRKTYWSLFADIVPNLYDIDNDGKPEILLLHTDHYLKIWGAIEILELDGFVTTHRFEFVDNSPEAIIPVKNRRTGENFIVVGTTKGRMLILDSTLSIVKDKIFDNCKDWDFVIMAPLQCVDVDGDGDTDILVKEDYVKYLYRTPRGAKAITKNKMLLLDWDLSVKRKWDNDICGAIYDLDGDGVNEIIFSCFPQGIEIWGVSRE